MDTPARIPTRLSADKAMAAAIAIATAAAAHAGPPLTISDLGEPPAGPDIKHEFSAEAGYSAPSKIGFLGAGGDMDAANQSVGYLATIGLAEHVFLRAGLGFERYSFSLPEGVPVPNTLQSFNLAIGIDASVSQHVVLRLEAQPGIYSDWSDISAKDFNVPFTLGGAYLVSDRLQYIFGARFDAWSDSPVLPGLGVRWQFADAWTLNFVLPKPRIEYKATDALTVFAGADLRGGTFRVSETFGEGWDRTRLNGAIVSYREIRAGVGASYQPAQTISLDLDAGWAIDREFDFPKGNLDVNSEGAPYAQASLKAKF